MNEKHNKGNCPVQRTYPNADKNMVLLVPLLVSAVAAPVLVSVLFVVFFFVNPAACIVVFGLYWVYQQWLYHYKSPKGDRKPTGWSVPDPVYCLRTGDPVVDELVQGDALPRVYAKYGSIVQTIKEKIEAETDKRRKELLQKLITQVESVPAWVDEEKLQRASQLYREHVVLISGGLSVALVESYAFPVDAEVLFISGGLTSSREGTIRRLMETGIWIYNIMKDGITVGSAGHSGILSVRFLHAFARKKCRENTEWQKDAKNAIDPTASAEENMKQIVKGRIEGEVPINQATMCATLFLFCHVVMEIAHLRGANLTDEDKECYWHYWRYVGYLLGVEEEVMPKSYFDGLAARESALYKGRQRPNEQSKILTENTIGSYCNMPNIPFDEGIFVVTVRKFLGDKLSDELGVPAATLTAFALWHTVRGFFVLCCVLNSLCPPLKAHFSWSLMQYINNAFLHFFVLSKEGTTEERGKCPFGFE